jgi:hypothetical protein
MASYNEGVATASPSADAGRTDLVKMHAAALRRGAEGEKPRSVHVLRRRENARILQRYRQLRDSVQAFGTLLEKSPPPPRENEQAMLELAESQDRMAADCRAEARKPYPLLLRLFAPEYVKSHRELELALADAWERCAKHLRALVNMPNDRRRWFEFLRRRTPEELALLDDESVVPLDADDFLGRLERGEL